MSVYSWRQPCCERCWIDANVEHVGNEFRVRLILPVWGIDTRLERCSFCGRATILGIYVRRDPATVPYPAEKRVENVDTDVSLGDGAWPNESTGRYYGE